MASQPPPAPKKSSLSVSRVILLLILTGALVALGIDQYAKYQMGKAYNDLDDLNKKNEAENVLSLPKDKVQQTLGREPSRTYPAGHQDVEEYDFPGVFYVYRVTVKFRKGINEYDTHSKQSIFRISGQ